MPDETTKKGRGRPPLTEEEREQRKAEWEWISARLRPDDVAYLRTWHPGSSAQILEAIIGRLRKLWPKGGRAAEVRRTSPRKRRKKPRRDRMPDALTRKGIVGNGEGDAL